MKKILLALLALTTLTTGAHAEQYTAVGSVSYIDRIADIVEVTDTDGNVWAFEGIEDWEEGNTCILLMSDMFTTDVTDDVIVAHGHYWGNK